MSNIIPDSVQKLIDEFSKLPGIGPKTASRLTFYLLHKPASEIEEFGKAILNIKENIKICPVCYNITDEDLCLICADKKRDNSKILVVEHPLDLVAIEKISEYNGQYHILGGAISPIDGIGPENLRINELFVRLKKDSKQISEVILATNTDLEGEATAMYVQKEILKIPQLNKIKVTRIARGLPAGGDLEYADEITLTRALEGRKEF